MIKPMNVDFTHNNALVLTGPQGYGKTRLALKIAAKYGAFIENDLRFTVVELDNYANRRTK